MAANRRFDTIQDELREAERWLQQLTREQTFRKAGLCSPTFGLHTAASDESHYEVSARGPARAGCIYENLQFSREMAVAAANPSTG
jgi:hypothetical protein